MALGPWWAALQTALGPWWAALDFGGTAHTCIKLQPQLKREWGGGAGVTEPLYLPTFPMWPH